MKSCIMEWQNAGLRQLCEAVPGKFVFWQSGFCRWQQWPALPAAGFDGLEVCFWELLDVAGMDDKNARILRWSVFLHDLAKPECRKRRILRTQSRAFQIGRAHV